jgi:transcriptional regulator with XRE-family HTH domain
MQEEKKAKQMNYAKGLRRAREQKHLSQRKLASLAGFDPSYITMLEGGKRKPSTEFIEKLASALGMPASLLLLMCAEKEDLRGIQPGRVKELFGLLVTALKEESCD